MTIREHLNLCKKKKNRCLFQGKRHSVRTSAVLIPVTEGGEAHGGRYKCYSPGEGHVATKKKGKHTGHTHGEKLTKEQMKTIKNQIDGMIQV